MNRRTLFTVIVVSGLLSITAFLFGAAGYGQSGMAGATDAIRVSGTVTAANGALYAWTGNTPQKRVFITNAPFSAANLYIRFNQDTADNDSFLYDFCLQPGDSWSGVQSMLIDRVAIFADAAVTYGDDFVIKGVD